MAKPVALETIDVEPVIPAPVPESAGQSRAGVANAPVHRGRAAAPSAHRVHSAAQTAPVVALPQPTAAESTEQADPTDSELAASDEGEGAGSPGASGSGAASGGGLGGLGGKASGTGVAARKPSLLAALPCNGFFPYRAPHDAATVAVAVAVNAAGAPISVRVESEAPRGEGFGNAAESCVRFARFRPATNAEGGPIASIARLELTFQRTR